MRTGSDNKLTVSEAPPASSLCFIVVFLSVCNVCSCLHGPDSAREHLVLKVAFPPTGEMSLKPLILRCQLPGGCPGDLFVRGRRRRCLPQAVDCVRWPPQHKAAPFVCNFQSFCRLRLLESDGLSSVSTQNRAVHSWMSCVSSCHVHVRVPIVLGELFISCLNANAGNCTLKLAAALLV